MLRPQFLRKREFKSHLVHNDVDSGKRKVAGSIPVEDDNTSPLAPHEDGSPIEMQAASQT